MDMDVGINRQQAFTGAPSDAAAAQETTATGGPRAPNFVDGITQSQGTQQTQAPEINVITLVQPRDVPEQQQEIIRMGRSTEENPDLALLGMYSDLAEGYNLNETENALLNFSFMTGLPSGNANIDQTHNEIEAMIAEELAAEFDFPSVLDQGKKIKEKGNETLTSGNRLIQSLNEQLAQMPDGPEKEALAQLAQQGGKNLSNLDDLLKGLGSTSDQSELAGQMKEIHKQINEMENTLTSLDNAKISDPSIQNTVSSLRSQLSESLNVLSGQISNTQTMQQLSNGDYSSIFNSLSADYQNEIKDGLVQNFNDLIKEKGLEGQADALRMGLNHPENASDDVKATVQQLLNEALARLSTDMGVPPAQLGQFIEANGVNTARFDAEMGFRASEAFDNLLAAKNLTPEEASMVREMHYNNASFPGHENLAQLAKALATQANDQIRAQFGIKGDFNIPKDNILYNAPIHDEFIQQFNTALQQSSFNEGQIQNIRNALADPLNPNISAETRQNLQAIYQQALTAVKGEYNLPDTWTPPINLLSQITTATPTMAARRNVASMIGDSLEIIKNTMKTMPDSPSKAMILDVLAAISEALSLYKDALSVMNMHDSKLASDWSQTRLELALFKIEEQQRKMEEIRKKKKKIPPGMKVFMDVMKFTMGAAMCLIAGPVGIALLATMIASKATGRDLVAEAMTSMMNELGPALGSVAAVGIIIVASIFSGGMAGILLFQQSKFCEVFLRDVCGVSPMAASITSMAVDMAIEIAVMIVLTIVTAGAASSLLAASITQKIAKASQFALRIVHYSLQPILKPIQMLGKGLISLGRTLSTSSSAAGRLTGSAMKNIGTHLVRLSKIFKQLGDDIVKYAEKAKNLAAEHQTNLKILNNLKKTAGQRLKTGSGLTPQTQSAIKNAEKAAEKSADAIEKHINLVERVYKGLTRGKMVLDAANSAQGAIASKIEGDIALIQGEMDAMIEEMEALIANIQKLLNSLMKIIMAQGDAIEFTSNIQKGIFEKQSQSLNQIFQG